MVVADGHGLPIGLYVANAQPHESQLADATLATVRVPQPRGRPRTRPKELVADKAYDSCELRQRLRRRGLKPTIPTFERRQRRQPKRGRPIETAQLSSALESRALLWVDGQLPAIGRALRTICGALQSFLSDCDHPMVHQLNFEIASTHHRPCWPYRW